MTPRVAILFDNFGPYHIARMLGAAAGCDVIALEASPSRGEYDWEKPPVPAPLTYVPLSGGGAAELDRLLSPLAPDCVALPGWSSAATLAVLGWCRRRSIPAILMSETNGWDFVRRPVAEFVKRRIVAHFAAGLVTSDSQASYLAELGLPADAIFRGYNAVDNAYFASRAAQVREAGLLPRALTAAIAGRYFLASSRFVEKKNISRLLAAYARFRDGRAENPADWPLVLLGDGPLRAGLEAERAALGLDAHVLMPGFQQIDALPLFYGTAGAFIHASTVEQWGLVVNEAMASGLPAAVSNRCGCAEILIEDGVTGLSFDPLDVGAIAAAFARLTDASVTNRMAQSGSARVAAWGPDRFGSGMQAAVRHALASGPRRPRAIDRAGMALAALRYAA